MMNKQCNYFDEPVREELSDNMKYRCLLDNGHEGEHQTTIVRENYFFEGNTAIFREGYGILRQPPEVQNQKKWVHKYECACETCEKYRGNINA